MVTDWVQWVLQQIAGCTFLRHWQFLLVVSAGGKIKWKNALFVPFAGNERLIVKSENGALVNNAGNCSTRKLEEIIKRWCIYCEHVLPVEWEEWKLADAESIV